LPSLGLAQGTNSGAGGGPVTSPLGAAQSSPTAPVSVVEPDDFNVCTGGNTCSVTGVGALFTQDMLGYESLSCQVTANAGADTITFESSNDGVTNWSATSGLINNATGGSPAVTTTTTTTPAIYTFSKKGEFIRGRVSAGAGTATVACRLHKSPVTNVYAAPTLQAGSVAIGKIGPGLTTAQTQIQGNATGTTGAVVGTLAGAASKTTWICDFDVSAVGTASTVGPIVVAGLLGGSKSYQLFATANGSYLSKNFTPCLQASAQNTAITITTTADATATAVNVNSTGYQE
jgi:hypothetical protein